jgi:hypothetical protein
MEKNIKDYLPFYLGCEVVVKEGSGVLCEITKSSNCSDRIVVKFNDVVTKYYDADGSHVKSSASAHAYYIGYEEIKLILRPLSDMSDEECSDIYTISRDRILHDYSQDDFHVIKNNNGFLIHRLDWLNEPLMLGFNGQIYSVVEDGNKKHIEPVRNQHEITKYLLSKQFDLFNLIPEGLAIDKTTLK